MAARDVVIISAVLFTLCLGCFILYFAGNTLADQLLQNNAINETQEFRDAVGGTKTAIGRLDYFALGVFIAFILGIMVTAWLVGSHPVFAIAFVIVDVIVVVVSTMFSYIWDQVTVMTVFGTTINNFPIANHLISNLGVYMAVIGVLALVVMFAKPAGSRGI